MRKRSFFATIAAVAVVLLLAATIVTPSLSAPLSGMPADIPATGDTWNYSLSGIVGTGNATLMVAGVADINAGFNESRTFHCYNYTTNYSTTTGSVKTEMILQTYYSMDGNVTAIYSYREDNDITTINGFYHFNETWKMFDFPLAEGKTWNKNIAVYFIGYNIYLGGTFDWSNATPSNITVTGFVVNVTTVTVEKGTFECWLVNETGIFAPNTYSLMWYNPDVKNVVYREDYSGGFKVVAWNMTYYSVSYPIHELIMMLATFTLFNTYQQQQQTNLRIMAGVGAAVIILVVAGVALYLRRR